MSTKLSAMLDAVALLAVLFGAGPASAADITGTPDNDVLPGTPKPDTIHGLAGNDTITPGRGNDRAFGDEGWDSFFWRNSDGHDQIDGGADGGGLFIDPAGEPLHLHFDTPAAGAKAAKGAQVISVAGIGDFHISGGDGPERLVLSSDDVFPPPDDGSTFEIGTGSGRDRIDLRRLRPRITYVNPGPGEDVIRLSLSYTEVDYHLQGFFDGNGLAISGHDTIYGFRGNHNIALIGEWPCSRPTDLDTNRDGKLSAKDKSVKVSDGSMTVDILAGAHDAVQGTTKVTFVGRTSLSVERIYVNDEGCLH